MVFDKSNLKNIRREIENALKVVETKYNVKFSQGCIKFNDSSFSMKLECSAVAEDGVVITQFYRDYIEEAQWYQLNPEWINKPFTYDSKNAKIIGLKVSRRKMPVLVDIDGSVFCFTPDAIRPYLENTYGKYKYEMDDIKVTIINPEIVDPNLVKK